MLKKQGYSSSALINNRFFRFLVAGGLAALVNFSSRFFYNLFLNFSASVVLAFMTGMATAYVLNKLFVFTTSKNTVPKEMGWFVVINILGLAQTWGVSVYLAEVLPAYLPVRGVDGRALAEALAHATGILVPVFTSYIGHKYLTFRE